MLFFHDSPIYRGDSPHKYCSNFFCSFIVVLQNISYFLECNYPFSMGSRSNHQNKLN